MVDRSVIVITFVYSYNDRILVIVIIIIINKLLLDDSHGTPGLTNKLLRERIILHNLEICRVLNISRDTLICFALALFGKGVFDELSKQSIMDKKGLEGADLLLSFVRGYLEGDEDDDKRLKDVLKCFEEVDSLKDMLVKIKKG